MIERETNTSFSTAQPAARVFPADPESGAVLRSLRQIIRAVDVQSRKLSRETGLTTPQYVVLNAVEELGEVTTRELSRHISLSQPTVTIMFDNLEKRGLVERYRSTADKRIVHSKLTGEGKAALEAAPPLLQEQFLSAFSGLSKKRRTEILSALTEVAQMMGADELDASPVLTIASPPAH